MTSIATLGPIASDGYQAAILSDSSAEIILYDRIPDVVDAFVNGETDRAIIPIYNTREGEIKEYFRLMEQLDEGYWVDNIVLPINLSLGAPGSVLDKSTITELIGRGAVFKQCNDFIRQHFPAASLTIVHNIDQAIEDIKSRKAINCAVIESEKLLKKHNLQLLEREVVSHNRTRYAVLAKHLPPSTGYDATSMITRPLKDRVGMLVDILNEFTRRGINILDLRSENDIKTQKLQIYIEAEGHIEDDLMQAALKRVEKNIIQEQDSLKVLGSFPRVDMRIKKIQSFGFVGTGDMSRWFADRLENEGYKTVLTGRNSKLKPEEMINQVDVVIICVPISVTADTIEQYGHLLKDGQAMIILAGESEKSIEKALAVTDQGVEIMLVHNLWGPQAITMKSKNAAVVRTPRSGSLCSEFEAFLYKHGADIYNDSASKHDLLMGVGQKLPTTISVALALTLAEHNIDRRDIDSHSTLTSLYGILAMARVHNQNDRTYAEIMATSGDGCKIVRTFAEKLLAIIDLAEQGEISQISQLIEKNRKHLTTAFLQAKMKQAKAVDTLLSDTGYKEE